MSKRPNTRSVFDLGDYNDNEVNNEPSLTDPSQDEPITKLVERLLRGEVLSKGSMQFDDMVPGESPEAAIDRLDITRQDGFDLADVPAVMQRAAEAAEGLKNEQKGPKEEPEKKSATPPEAPKENATETT